ncbi:MAG: serine hydrolase domain-containing protein [Acidimicrobiia bacterium]
MSSPAAVEARGRVEPGFEPVADAFVRNFEEQGDVGAACCVYRDGRPVVDIFGGVADPAAGRAWADDTIVLTYSCTKGVIAVCANLLIQRGELDPDAPVADYWPEFAANGKGEIPVRFLLSHRAGLPVIEGEFTMSEALAWTPVVDALAAQAPIWEPGTAHGYHLRSYGWLVGEVIRRVTGRTAGRFFAEEIAAPLDLEFWIGLPEELEPRVAPVVPPAAAMDFATLEQLMPPEAVAAIRGPSDLFAYDEMWNRRELRATELPSSNGIGDACSLARLYASLVGEVDGVRTLEAATVKRATEPQCVGPDRIIMFDMCYGLGFMRPPGLLHGTAISMGPAAFGHGGAGGSFTFADPDAGVGFAYVMNRLRFDLDDCRAAALVAATYAALASTT